MKALVAAVLLLVAVDARMQQVRDQPARRPGFGTGAVAGRVINGESRQPIGDAVVTLVGGETTTIRVGQTDGTGAFILPGVPAGKFLLSASKPSYLGAMHGATRPGRPGTSVVLTDGQILAGLEINMWPGAVVTGIVTDEQGEPVPDAEVQVQLSGTADNQMTRMVAEITGGSRSTTDDRGVYRIYGVGPGEYLVFAAVPDALAQPRRLAPGEVAEGLRALRESKPAPAPPVRQAGSLSSFAPVYFPGTTDVARAATVSVGMGDERTGVDIRMEVVPLVRVDGTVFAPDGSPGANVQVSLRRLDDNSITALMRSGSGGRTSATGQFTLRNVAPGQYRLLARTGSSGAGAAGPVLWGSADVAIGGQDVPGLVLQLQPGLSIAGRVLVEATRLPALSDLTTVRVVALPVSSVGDQIAMLGAMVGGQGGQSARADGTFEVSGLIPGPHLVTAVFGGGAVDLLSWNVRSVVIDGREVVDLPFDLKPGAAPKNVVLTLTDVQQELTGVIADAGGRPLTASTVMLFASDRRFWYPNSRRVLAVRPGTDGSYEFRGILSPAAGDYYLSVVTDLDPNQQYDPAFLDALAKAAPLRLTIGAGEKKTQNLQVK